ncbi:probable protein phosphatase 2C 24 isoform X2 [Mercurialis annua]|nr:probable protein phosphatase 2C 24 isoform X2 [Mercurialis annua]XP_050203911.1 probable protein phosphatase 2C 24 isoform X2 [Mercurialis annua]XP_050203912.1 probable protein phosphatase 2C 24 isoform X2 [Mercurialis annua]
MEIRRVKFVTGVTPEKDEGDNNNNVNGIKRRKIEVTASCNGAGGDTEECSAHENGKPEMNQEIVMKLVLTPSILLNPNLYPKYGVASVCGRRRDMEDAVAVYPSFFKKNQEFDYPLHYFGVYDGHGCSHVAMRCRERLHELVKEEAALAAVPSSLANGEWKKAMERSFSRMDKEAIVASDGGVAAAGGGGGGSCRCEMQTPECDAVGSTAVVAVITRDKIIVANCGDSRAVLSRNGKPVPLSIDHKPDRPDELNRIQAAGGRVIYWDGPRVLGVLAMSRAIGDNYLKPYVSCEPEVTVTERTAGDDCLILASDGLWDVVSNDTACGVARMCLRGKGQVQSFSTSPENDVAMVENGGGATSSGGGENSDKACSDASMLLTKLALARRSTDNVSVVVVDLRRDTWP